MIPFKLCISRITSAACCSSGPVQYWTQKKIVLSSCMSEMFLTIYLIQRLIISSRNFYRNISLTIWTNQISYAAKGGKTSSTWMKNIVITFTVDTFWVNEWMNVLYNKSPSPLKKKTPLKYDMSNIQRINIWYTLILSLLKDVKDIYIYFESKQDQVQKLNMNINPPSKRSHNGQSPLSLSLIK